MDALTGGAAGGPARRCVRADVRDQPSGRPALRSPSQKRSRVALFR